MPNAHTAVFSSGELQEASPMAQQEVFQSLVQLDSFEDGDLSARTRIPNNGTHTTIISCNVQRR